jgi:hypothetical protein
MPRHLLHMTCVWAGPDNSKYVIKFVHKKVLVKKKVCPKKGSVLLLLKNCGMDEDGIC